MKMLRSLVAVAAIWLGLAPAFAANQASIVTPTSGPMSAATFTGTYLNPALLAIFTCNWGPTAPFNGPAGAPATYQMWCNTTSNPTVVQMYDGTSWVSLGTLNTSTHVWNPALANGTGLPIATGVSGLGAGVATFLATPTSANLRAAVTDEVGTGALYFVGGALGTPASVTLTFGTGLPANGGLTGQVPVANGGTGGATASGTLLDNITAFSSTGFLTRTGAGTYAFQSATNGITNANLAQGGAFTLKGNATSGTANETDIDVTALTAKAAPVSGDLVLIHDSAASFAFKKATVGSIASAGSVASIGGNTGAFTLNSTSGITNSTNDIILQQASASQFGAVKVDNATVQAVGGVLSTKNTPVLLATLTASGSTSLSDTTHFTSTYSSYELVFHNLVTSTTAVALLLQVHSGGSFQTASYVDSVIINTTGYAQIQAINSIWLTNSGVINTSAGGVSGVIRLTGFNIASTPKWWTGQVSMLGTSSLAYLIGVSGMWNSTSAIDGFQVCFATTAPTCNTSGITSGVVEIYGYP